MAVPDGLGKEVFQRALDALLPAGPPTRHAVLAGPGQPAADADADILLVPTHPQTGQTWTPASPGISAYLVPLPLGVWLWLAFPKPHLPLPASGGMPDGVLRDDPPAPRPRYSFRADSGVFQHTLVRLPAVRGCGGFRKTSPSTCVPGSSSGLARSAGIERHRTAVHLAQYIKDGNITHTDGEE